MGQKLLGHGRIVIENGIPIRWLCHHQGSLPPYEPRSQWKYDRKPQPQGLPSPPTCINNDSEGSSEYRYDNTFQSPSTPIKGRVLFAPHSLFENYGGISMKPDQIFGGLEQGVC